MAQTTVRTPDLRSVYTLNANSNTQLLNGTDDSSGIIFVAPKTGNISKVHAWFSAKNGTTMVVSGSIQGVAAGRTPDGTIKGATNNATVDVTNPSTGVWTTFTLAEVADVTVGDQLSAVIRFVSGSTDITVDRAYTGPDIAWGGPYAFSQSAGTYARNIAHIPTIAVEYDDGTTIVGYPMRASSVASSWNSGSNPLIRGMKWTPATTCVIDGFWIGFIRVQDTFDFAAEMYTAGSGTPTFTATFEGDKVYGSNGATQYIFVPTGDITLTAETAYRFTVRPTTANDSVTAMLLTWMDADAFANTWDTFSTRWCSTVNNAQDDSWTDDSTLFTSYAIFPRIKTVDTGSAGGGGMQFVPNLSGT